MTLRIDLGLEYERRLLQEAEKHGLSANEYARCLIERHLPPAVPVGQSLWRTLTPEEWIREFEAWTESHRGLPVLPPKAYDRASFYEGPE